MRLLTLFPILILEEWTPLVSLEAFGCYGMKAPRSKWKFSPTTSIVYMRLGRCHRPPIFFTYCSLCFS